MKFRSRVGGNLDLLGVGGRENKAKVVTNLPYLRYVTDAELTKEQDPTHVSSSRLNSSRHSQKRDNSISNSSPELGARTTARGSQ